MEYKQSKRRWKIPVLLVSAICILLASSFVFHTTAEASVLTYSLQGSSFGNPVLDDGSVSSVGLDRALIDNYSVTAQNQYVGVTQENFSLTGNVYSALSTFAVGVWDCSSVYAAYRTSSGSNDVRLYTANGVVDKTYSVYPEFFFSDRFLSGSSVYDLEGNLLGTFSIDSNIVSVFFRNEKYFIFYLYNGYFSIYVYDSGFSRLHFAPLYSGSSSALSCCYCTDEYAVWFSQSTSYILDLESFAFSTKKNGSGWYRGYMTRLGDRLYGLYNGIFYLYDLELNFLFRYDALNLPAIASSSAKLNNFCGALIIQNTSASYTIASIPNQYYANFSALFVDSFTPSKWINFSCKPSSDGSVVGGDAVGIKLDYALSDEYLVTVGAYGVKVSGCTILASLDDLSTGIGYYGLPPLVVKVNGSAVPRITKEYESVEKVGDVYLYAFSAFCDFQGSTKINSLEIYMNCFVPKQLSRHSFSLPVSGVELYLEPAGGGTGGESSDTSSGGGGGTSSDSSSGGTSSEDHPSDIPPEWERNSVEFWFRNRTQDFFLGTYDMWDADTLQVYFGGYAVGSMEPVPTRIRFLKNDVVTEEIRFENFVFQGWSYSYDLSSFEYPTFSGRFVTVPLDSSRRIYLTDYLSNPQLFIADYGAGMLALVNFDSTDSYLTVVNSETLETTITVNNSTVDSMIIYGKVMEYSFFTLSEYISWQPYEEGGVYIHANDWSLYDDVYAGLYLHTYITETPPPTVDWWVEYSMELEAERSRLAELESKANQLYGDVSYDPLDDAGFIDAVSSYTGVIATDAADGVFSLIQKMWSANPYFTYFVAITVAVCCCMFYLRKL